MNTLLYVDSNSLNKSNLKYKILLFYKLKIEWIVETVFKLKAIFLTIQQITTGPTMKQTQSTESAQNSIGIHVTSYYDPST